MAVESSSSPSVDALVAAYGQAVLHTRRVNRVEGALITNAVVVSAESASRWLAHKYPRAKRQQASLATFVEAAKGEDYTARVISRLNQYHSEAKKLVLTAFSLALGTSLLLSGLISQGPSGRDLITDVVGRFGIFWIPACIVGALVASVWKDAIVEAWKAGGDAKAVLARYVDAPEGSFFAAIGAPPPRRDTLNLAGPLTATTLAALAIVAGILVAGLATGAGIAKFG